MLGNTAVAMIMLVASVVLNCCSNGGGDVGAADPYPAAVSCNSSKSPVAGLRDDAGESPNPNDKVQNDQELVPQYCKSKNPTWYGNVLPLINSRVDGQKYQCSTCHDNYKKYDVTKRELNEFMASMKQTGVKFMPRVGNRVPEDCLDMLELWQDGDYPMGNKDEEREAVAIEQQRDRDRQLAFAKGESLKNADDNSCPTQSDSD